MSLKYFLVLICFTVAPFFANAKCGGSGIGLQTKTIIPQNGIIIIEFYGGSQYIASGLNKRHPIYLQSGDSKVTLTVVEVLGGDFQLTQAILRPSTLLSFEKMYTVFIDDINNKLFPPRLLNEKTKSWSSGPITVTSNLSTNTAFNYTITETKKTYVRYGCGPASWVYYNISGIDSSISFVRTTVKSLRTNNLSTYVVPIENGQIKLGHGMCSGPFLFNNAGNYEATFTLLNQSFEQKGQSQTLVFSQPNKQTEEE